MAFVARNELRTAAGERWRNGEWQKCVVDWLELCVGVMPALYTKICSICLISLHSRLKKTCRGQPDPDIYAEIRLVTGSLPCWKRPKCGVVNGPPFVCRQVSSSWSFSCQREVHKNQRQDSNGELLIAWWNAFRNSPPKLKLLIISPGLSCRNYIYSSGRDSG